MTNTFTITSEQKVLIYGIAAKMAKDKVDPVLLAMAVDLATKRESTFKLFMDYPAASIEDRKTLIVALSYDIQIPYVPEVPKPPSKGQKFLNGLITLLTLRNLWRS